MSDNENIMLVPDISDAFDDVLSDPAMIELVATVSIEALVPPPLAEPAVNQTAPSSETWLPVPPQTNDTNLFEIVIKPELDEIKSGEPVEPAGDVEPVLTVPGSPALKTELDIDDLPMEVEEGGSEEGEIKFPSVDQGIPETVQKSKNPSLELVPCQVKLRRLQVPDVLDRDKRVKFLFTDDNLVVTIVPKSEPSSTAKPSRGQRKAKAGVVALRTEMDEAPIKVEPEEMNRDDDGMDAMMPVDESQTEMSVVSLSAPVNVSLGPDLRTLFMGQSDQCEEWWINLIAKRKGNNRLLVYQCSFCPETRDIPKLISDHLESDHPDLAFAVNRCKRSGLNPITYFFCRHCDFVSSEAVIMWIHFEIFHGVIGILDSSTGAKVIHNDVEFRPLPSDSRARDITTYVCLECSAVADTSKQMIYHVLKDHPGSDNYNGYFVKSMQLERPVVGRPVPTYDQMIKMPEFVSMRRECYLCTSCTFVAYSAYLAIAHNVQTHHSMKLAQVCMHHPCSKQFLSEKEFAHHIRVKHPQITGNAKVLCSVSLVENSSNGDVKEVAMSNRKQSK